MCYFKLFILFLVFFLESILSKKMEKIQIIKNNVIVDNGFKIIPKNNYIFLDDIVLVIIPFFYLIYVMIYFKNFMFDKFLLVFIIIRLLRLICMVSTIYPPPDTEFIYIVNEKKKIIPYYDYIFGGCNETIFSGHTSFMVLIFLFVYEYYNIFIRLLLFIYTIFGSILIISSRSHYTTDVLLAWIITTLVYSVFKK